MATRAQLIQLQTEAERFGDQEQVDLCQLALSGEDGAMAACDKALAAALAAQVDEINGVDWRSERDDGKAYLDATIDGHRRITKIEWSDEVGRDEAEGAMRGSTRISESDLPSDFDTWRVYTGSAGLRHWSTTYSRDGD